METSAIIRPEANPAVIRRALLQQCGKAGFDLTALLSACNLVELAHADQIRKADGAPYVGHAYNVAKYALRMGCGQDGVVAAVLHDVKEDAPHLAPQILRQFGPRVDEIVGVLTKDDRIADKSIRTAEARARVGWWVYGRGDVEAGLVKLADRVHNLRTSWHLDAETIFLRRMESALFYRPLAEHLGKPVLGWWLVTPSRWNSAPSLDFAATRATVAAWDR